MSYLNFLAIVMFAVRMGTLIITAVLSINLIASWWANAQKETNGLRASRITMIVLVLSLFFENFLYSLSYVHSRMDFVMAQHWISQSFFWLVIARIILFYAVIRLLLLFHDTKKKE